MCASGGSKGNDSCGFIRRERKLLLKSVAEPAADRGPVMLITYVSEVTGSLGL